MSSENEFFSQMARALSPEISLHDITKAHYLCGDVYGALNKLHHCLALSGSELIQASFPGKSMIETPYYHELKAQFNDRRKYLEQHDSPTASCTRHSIEHQVDVMNKLESAMLIIDHELSRIGDLDEEIGFFGLILPRCIASPSLGRDGYCILQKWRNRESINDCDELRDIVEQAENLINEVWRVTQELRDCSINIEDASTEGSMLRRRRT
ncbi:hypothetical protein BDD12DRAFT_908402 [Trichophaea hybrida]|nr:hypothetical protein BDD12DRAFT_908402 [Trichophaea hybrida]